MQVWVWGDGGDGMGGNLSIYPSQEVHCTQRSVESKQASEHLFLAGKFFAFFFLGSRGGTCSSSRRKSVAVLFISFFGGGGEGAFLVLLLSLLLLLDPTWLSPSLSLSFFLSFPVRRV